jgi:hypothetical protein
VLSQTLYGCNQPNDSGPTRRSLAPLTPHPSRRPCSDRSAPTLARVPTQTLSAGGASSTRVCCVASASLPVQLAWHVFECRAQEVPGSQFDLKRPGRHEAEPQGYNLGGFECEPLASCELQSSFSPPFCGCLPLRRGLLANGFCLRDTGQIGCQKPARRHRRLLAVMESFS